MKKSYAMLIVVLVILGLWYFTSNSKKVEAPALSDTSINTDIQTEVKTQTPAREDMTLTEEVNKVKEFNISAENFSLAPSGITVKKGDTVRITFKNLSGNTNHGLVIKDFNITTKVLKAGDEETVEFIADKVGTFSYYCPVGSHKAMGMEGTLKVE